MSYDRICIVLNRICELVAIYADVNDTDLIRLPMHRNQWKQVDPNVLRARIIVRYFGQEMYERGVAPIGVIGRVLANRSSLSDEWFMVRQTLSSDEHIRRIVDSVTPEFNNLLTQES